VLMTELSRAVEVLDRGEPLTALWTPIDPERAHPWLLVVELEAPTEDSLEALEGFVRGRAAAFVRALERSLPDDGPTLRPYPLARSMPDVNHPLTSRLVFGLDTPSASPPPLPEAPLRELERAGAEGDPRPPGAVVRISPVTATTRHRG
jgi:hypothetical protein